MSDEEWRVRLGTRVEERSDTHAIYSFYLTDDQIDTARYHSANWQNGDNIKGYRAVTRVKNQGNCGSCWAFATIGCFESIYAIAGNPLTAFSEEFLINCVEDPRLNKCGGGSPLAAAERLTENYIPLERDCEYFSYDPSEAHECYDLSCHWSNGNIVAKKALKIDVRYQNMEEAMAAYLYCYGPMVVSVDASSDAWKHYRAGIIDQCPPYSPSTTLNHAVLLVGYGTDHGTPYWLVKNSWTPLWGEEGYGRILRVTVCAAFLHSPSLSSFKLLSARFAANHSLL